MREEVGGLVVVDIERVSFSEVLAADLHVAATLAESTLIAAFVLATAVGDGLSHGLRRVD
jgi:hypothetical protein